MRKLLVLGATSAIAQEVQKLFAKDGDWFYLVARDPAKLKTVADDLAVRGAGKVESHVADLEDHENHSVILKKAYDALKGIDIVFVAYGYGGDQKISEKDFLAAEKVIRTNFTSVVSLLDLVAERFEADKKGTIAVISSVAGDRGKRSNYIYGSSKAALTVFLQGLRNRLSSSGVHVLTIKPGFVDTPMTVHIEKRPLVVRPQVVAPVIYRAILNKKEVVYVPWFWQGIMKVLCSIPEQIFKKLSL